MRKLIYPTLFVIVGMMLSSMTATQAIPAQSTYYACVKKTSGAMKMVSASKKCTKKEKKISWNAVGVPGPAGEDGGYEVLLTPSDFATNPTSLLADLEQINLDGYPRSAWVFQNAATGVETILASFATPSSWAGATAADVTIYWMAENNSGSINVYSVGGVQKIGMPFNDALDGLNSGFNGVPAAGVFLETTNRFNIGLDPDLIDVTFHRYMNGGADTNTGKIYIFGAKVEPVFE